MRTLYKLLLSVVIAIAQVLTPAMSGRVMAQSETDAFYIYQNDGHFDGFFYDQVQRISYSRVDTAGIEWDEYVSQEIVTADSTYRIMLTAIDSVSFVQPEIRFNPNVRFMRDEGMMDYLTAYSGLMLTFSADMPVSLMPKVGDVLACPNIDGEQTTFVGKVVSVYEFDGSIIAHCELIEDPSDVYIQFITVEEVRANEATGEVRRRVAGLNKPRRAEGNWEDVNLFNCNIDFEHDWHLSPHWNLVTNVHAGFGMTASLAYKLTLSEFYIKANMKAFFELGLKVGVDGYVEGTYSAENIPVIGALAKRFTRVPFPANMPIMYAKVMPEPFIRGEAHLNVSLNTGVRLQPIRLSFEILDKKPFLNLGIFNEPGKIIDGNFSVSAELNGMMQLGMMFPLKIGVEDWFAKVYQAEIGETVYAGPKITGSLTLGSWFDGKDNFYEKYKDTKLDLSLFSLDNELKATTKPALWKGQKHEFKITRSFSLYGMTLKLFPDVKEFFLDVTGERKNNITGRITEIRGDVFLPQQIGVALYDKEDNVYRSAFRDETYYFNTFNDVTVQFEDVEPGIYKVRPVIRFLSSPNFTPIYALEETVAIGAPVLSLKPKSVSVDEEGGETYVNIDSSSKVVPECYASKDWIHPEINAETFWLTARVDANPTMRYREGVVYVTQQISDTEILRDSIVVKQYGGINLSKGEIDFDVDGGLDAVDVRTMLTGVDVNVKGGDNWLRADLGGEALTIAATKNNGAPRSATVTLAAFNKAGDGIVTASVEVRQKGLITVSMDTILFDNRGVYGGSSMECAVVINSDVKDLEFELETDEAPWIQYNIRGNGLFVWTSGENKSQNWRIGNIYVVATDSTHNLRVPILVMQEPNPFKIPYIYLDTDMNDEISVDSEGGLFPVGVNTNIDDVNVSCDGTWCRAIYEDGELTLKCAANDTGKERRCKLKASVSYDGRSDEAEATVVQAPITKLKAYDGWAFSVRHGGSAFDLPLDMMRRSTYPYTYPNRGVCGNGSVESASNWSLTSHGSRPLGAETQSWRAHFDNVKGVLYGHVYYERASATRIESYEFSISGMPVGTVGLLSQEVSLEAQAGATSWYGDGGATYWKTYDGSPCHVSSYCHTVRYMDDNDIWQEVIDTDPVEITVYLHIKGSSTVVPVCEE